MSTESEQHGMVGQREDNATDSAGSPRIKAPVMPVGKLMQYYNSHSTDWQNYTVRFLLSRQRDHSQCRPHNPQTRHPHALAAGHAHQASSSIR